ncbi:MAG: alpha-L-fucosidase [Clostridia bacterium]|nr:alpha-L-fucosidase [Clostridia bacterium]
MSRINKDYFAHARVGLFTHYTYATYAEGKGTNWGGTHYSQTDPRGAVSAEEAASLFDGEKYARTAHDLGAEYVVFTVCHAGFNLLFPSEVMKATGCTRKCTESSDVVQKLIDGLKPYGIPLVLYMPPNDDHDIPEEDLKKLGWFENPPARMEFHKRLIREIYDRYGMDIAGFWFDQGGPDRSVCDFVKACNPDAVVFINTGITANDKLHPNSDFIVSEYYGSIEGCDSDTLPVHYSQVNRQIGNWWATGGHAPTNARNLYRYSVRTIAVEGQYNCGIAWSCGPYLDQTWEDGVRDLLGELGDLLKSHEGIYGTVPGKSWVEEPNAILTPEQWGVSTESPDGSVVYLHVLNCPADGVLHLAAPADGKKFTEAWYRNTRLSLTAEGDGYVIGMPAEIDEIDTVVRLIAG